MSTTTINEVDDANLEHQSTNTNTNTPNSILEQSFIEDEEREETDEDMDKAGDVHIAIDLSNEKTPDLITIDGEGTDSEAEIKEEEAEELEEEEEDEEDSDGDDTMKGVVLNKGGRPTRAVAKDVTYEGMDSSLRDLMMEEMGSDDSSIRDESKAVAGNDKNVCF